MASTQPSENTQRAGKTPKGSKTRLRIREAAIELFAQNGFYATSLSDIGERASIQRGALYYHIQAKEELLFEIVSEIVEAVLEQGRTIAGEPLPAAERFRRMIVFQTQALLDRRDQLIIYMRDGYALTGERRERFRQMQADVEAIWASVLHEGQEAGEMRQVDPAGLKSIILLVNSPYAWFHPGGRLDSTEVGEIIADLVLRGIEAPSKTPGE
ncbi:TetR/AcrR family transcriptional regulator [Pseudonocardia endophytica]|uniref:TetR family transcriptional regulator n=1 Tax=Pseudonocardia endophytica TaxID=401976 RepID=A0A4R1HQ51_PSEEN|nr:TetR/AcrR family transcriptional regulator [Pseudonocardia endophytica]TCK22825.1 TetR family transcriptional regulator [Pseudonocardia endophytica]